MRTRACVMKKAAAKKGCMRMRSVIICSMASKPLLWTSELGLILTQMSSQVLRGLITLAAHRGNEIMKYRDVRLCIFLFMQGTLKDHSKLASICLQRRRAMTQDPPIDKWLMESWFSICVLVGPRNLTGRLKSSNL